MKYDKNTRQQPKNLFVLLGDSHTRSYKLSNYLATRVFLAQGRKNNFKNNLHFIQTTFRYIRVARKFRSSGLKLAFVVGEPDVRWLAYGKWDIGRNEEDVLNSSVELDIDNLQLKFLINRIKIFLSITKMMKLNPNVVIGSGSPNPEMFLASLKFNKKLSELCQQYCDCLFFDPQLESNSGANRVKDKYIGYSVFKPEQRDTTHLSTDISKKFDKFIFEHVDVDVCDNKQWKKKSNFDEFFIEINSFDTYKLKDSLAFKMIRQVVRFLKRKSLKQ